MAQVSLIWSATVRSSRSFALTRRLGVFVAQLQIQRLVETIDAFRIDRPAVTPQQDMHTPVAVPHARLADLFDPLFECGLTATLRLVDIECPINPEGGTGAPDRYLPIASHLVHQFAFAGRPQSFFASTS